VRAGVKALSRDGARQLFEALEIIAKAMISQGRGWYGLRRQAADLAEGATSDDRLKDRLGGWQDSETRKSIYQDRETDALRAQAASVRRQLRPGKGLKVPVDFLSTVPNEEPSLNNAALYTERDDVEELWASLTHEQRRQLVARISKRARLG
jgi:hypothetical protein